MKKLLAILVMLLLLFPASHAAGEEYGKMAQELKALKEKVEMLEKELEARERVSEERIESEVKELKSIKEALKGIEVEGGLTVVGQGTLNSDHGKNRAYEKETDMSYSANLIISKTVDMGRLGKGTASLFIEGASGPDSWLKNLQDSSWSSVSEDYNSPVSMDNVDIREAWYEQNLFGDKLILTLGKLDVTAYVDENEVANDEEVQFLGGEFVNNPIVPFPDYGPGFRITVNPKNYLTLTAVLMSVEGDDEGSSSWSDIFDGVFGVGQVGIKANPFGLSGNYRFMGWFNTSKHTDYDDGRERDKNNYGFAVSLDQEVLKDTLTLFLRSGWCDPDVNEASFYVGLGGRLSGRWWKRPNDEVAIAYGLTGESDEFRDYERYTGEARTKNQHHVEAYYKLSFGEHLEITLDYQFLANPGGHRDIDDAHLLGVRTHFAL